jgi:two-component system sensor kinase FixL
MVEDERRDWTIWLRQQRRLVLKVIFLSIMVLGFVGLVIAGYQAISTGSITFNLLYYILTYVGLVILYLFRKIPDLWRSIGYLLLLYIFGVLSLYTGWLAGGGRIFLLAMIVMTAVLIHPRAGLVAAILSLLTFAGYGLAFNQHWFILRTLPDPTSIQPIILEGIGYAIVIAVVSLGLWYFGKALMAADQANRETQEARVLLDEHARQLEAANALIASQAEASLQDSEAKLHDVIQQANDAIFLSDERGIITNWNYAAEKITGIKSQEAIGKSLWKVQSQILSDERRKSGVDKQFRKLITEVLRTGASDFVNRLLEGEIQRKDGSRRYFQQLAFPIKTAKGFMLGTIIRDITEKKQIEIEREELIQKLETKNAELERFTYTVSHDLKSPLITIQGFLGYIEKDAISGNHERFSEDVQRINNAVVKMQRLLNELLELSRIGRLINPPVDIPFDSVIQEALLLTEGRLKEHNVKIEVEPDLPSVYGDRTRLVEVIQNLVDNAAKFMGDQTKPLIHIGMRKSEDQVIFFVRDNGIGIEPQYIDRVFGLFNKLDPKSEGTGVGLSLAKRIVEVHGGRIWLESEGIRKGTTVYFTLAAIPDQPV